MPRNVNRIRNADFRLGNPAPRHWTWTTSSPAARGERAPEPSGGLSIHHPSTRGLSRLEQSVACRPGRYYRVEAEVSCDLRGGENAGLLLTLRGDDAALDLCSAPVLRSTRPIVLRAYLEAPQGVAVVSVGVAIRHARGRAVVHRVRFIPILEPEEEAHAMAILPPVSAHPAPRGVRTACIVSAHHGDRPLSTCLRLVLGEKSVTPADPGGAIPDAPDALIFPDDAPPRELRSLAALLALAERKIVLVSLPALAALSRGVLRVRVVEQDDDPIHARVVYSTWATAGFALHDCFPHAWAGRAAGSFVQRQFRPSPSRAAFLKRHRLTVLLDSMCDRDSTSHQPVALFRAFPRGALFVVDLHPLETAPSTFNEPTITLHLLKALLGLAHPGLGQYTVPARTAAQLRRTLHDFADRFPAVAVHDERDTQTDDQPVLVTVGGDDEAFGLPLRPKPLILLRTGLTGGEAESVYSAWPWIKQLLRPPPHPCGYAETLARRFRFAWVPTAAPWHVREGWSARPLNAAAASDPARNGRAARGEAVEMTLDLADAALGALIDVTTTDRSTARVAVPDEAGAHRRILDHLSTLAALAFPAPVHAFAPQDDAPFSDRDRYAWREITPRVEVVRDRFAFRERIHRDAQRGGAALVRIELPRSESDFVAHSIHRTALGAALIELTVGLVHGTLAVNRGLREVALLGIPPLPPGETWMRPNREPESPLSR